MDAILVGVSNCNNIDSATITLSLNKLNIKFAPNGTGKSTIARAIVYDKSSNEDALKALMPFKLRGSNPEAKVPSITGLENLNNILCFNEEYVNQFVFKQKELLNNSFDILIRTEAYKNIEMEIEDLVSEIKRLFSGNQELETLIKNLKEMGAAFKLTKSGISRSSTGMKGLSGGNKIHHIPKGLEAYQPFIQSKTCVGWVDWQIRGCEYIELSEYCPFCASHAVGSVYTIKKVGQEYDKNTIKNLVDIINIIERLGEYFSPDAKSKLAQIISLQEGLEKEHELFFANVKGQIETFVGNLEKVSTLSGFQFNEGDNVVEKLRSYKLDLDFFSELKSEKMLEAIGPINESIDDMVDKAGLLKGKINQQRAEMQKVIKKHQENINGFLSYAGYSYIVEVAGEADDARLRLLHVDHAQHLDGGAQHLSFGERNAFAIVLFMYECLSKNPDLIILDDPISSFDKNKKYAILEMLFRRKTGSCLKNKTVLMLTHDVEPIIDTVKSLSDKFSNQTSASFLKMIDGEINEIAIAKDDIRTFSQICNDVVASDKEDVVKLIYMRRHYEINDNRSDAYQVLSNILHNREVALDKREPRNAHGEYPPMDSIKFCSGQNEIASKISGFSYSEMLTRISETSYLKTLYQSSSNGYEKLQIFRLMGLDAKNTVVQKFINETYHIENEFICQLDPTKYDTIPEYIIKRCDEILLEA